MGIQWKIGFAGLCAGAINGLLGAGGGMVLVPLLSLLTDLKEEEIFPSSIAIILPLCIVSLFVTAQRQGLNIPAAVPYLLGSALGAIPAGLWGQKIPILWLHRALGLMILWGGLRYLL